MYKLKNTVDADFYVGSTCSSLVKRRGGHKKDAVKRPNAKVYTHFNNIGWDNVMIELIENFPCNSKDELLKREQELIDELAPTLNMHKAFGYDHKVYNANYHAVNKQAIADRKAIKILCECGVTAGKASIASHKKTKKHFEYINNLI